MDTTAAPPTDTPLPGMSPVAPAAGPRAVTSPRPRPRTADRKPAPAAAPNTLPRLSVPTTADGSKIAYDVMQPKVKERLRQVLLDPELPAALGLTPITAPGGAVEKFPADLLEMGFDYLGNALALVAQKRGATAEQIAAMRFNAQEKTALTEPAGRLVDKYFPGGLGRWGDEVMFAITVLMIMDARYALLRSLKPNTPAHRAPNGEVVQFPQQNQQPPQENVN